MNSKCLFGMLIVGMSTLIAGCGGGGGVDEFLCSRFRSEIVQQPRDAAVEEGADATFSVVVSSCSAVKIGATWEVCNAGNDAATCTSSKLWSNVTDGVSSDGFSLTIRSAKLADDGKLYRANITSNLNPFFPLPSGVAKLTVMSPASPVIVTQPSHVTVNPGQSPSFSVVATGANLAYQWQRSNDAGATFSDIVGATVASYTLSGAQLGDNDARFRVRVSNLNGQAVSDAAHLTVSALAPIAFNDDTFAKAGWTLTIYMNGNGGSATAEQAASGGNPGAYGTVTTQVNAAPDATSSSSVFSFHWNSGAIYDPAASGPIISIDYAQDALLITGSQAGQATSLALRQDGKVFYAAQAYEITPERQWTAKGKLGLVATDFVFIDADLTQTTQRPDFSVQGKPIEFGFLRANSTATGGAGYSIVGGIDNWSVTIHRGQ